MPEIGATLREARMRQRVDITDIESRTKIRAKYLRALENEEWDLLPGPTFVKTFLRTYAEALDLDARLLVEEYKLRYERLSDHDLLPIAPPSPQDRRARRGSPGVVRDVLVAVLVVGLVAALILLGSDGGDEEPTRATGTVPASEPGPAPVGDGHGGREERPGGTDAPPRRVSLRIVPRGPVYVCLKAGRRVLLGEETITRPTRTYRARSFRVLLGNDQVSLRIAGRRRSVARSSEPVAYAISRTGERRRIAARPSQICR